MTDKTKTLPKVVGMIHVKGVNDERWAKHLKALAERDKGSKPQVMISIVNNRW